MQGHQCLPAASIHPPLGFGAGLLPTEYSSQVVPQSTLFVGSSWTFQRLMGQALNTYLVRPMANELAKVRLFLALFRVLLLTCPSSRRMC
jgi:hypothetical protein